MADDAISDEPTILRFRQLLANYQLPEQLVALVRGLLEAQGLLMKPGTLVDGTIINAPSSTKNAMGTRDPEMQQTRKGKNSCFGRFYPLPRR